MTRYWAEVRDNNNETLWIGELWARDYYHALNRCGVMAGFKNFKVSEFLVHRACILGSINIKRLSKTGSGHRGNHYATYYKAIN